MGGVDFVASAYGMNDDVSLDAGYVSMAVMRATPEVRVPIQGDKNDGVLLGLLPSLICERTMGEDGGGDCGWGVGVALTSVGVSEAGQFSGRFDFEQVGDVNRIGGQIGYSFSF
jgi:hypothetical protein